MNISVIGTGYVGLVTGACFAEFGLHVTCMDKDEQRIAALEKGKIPIYEPGLSELVHKGLSDGRLTFTTNLVQAVESALVIFIAVGTPSQNDGSADLSFVEDVGRGIATHLNGYKVIVTKSTVPVGTGEHLRKLIGSLAGKNAAFDIVSNPEFLREGSAIEDFMRPNRVIIGAQSPHAIAVMRDLYRPLYLTETPFVLTDIPTAEMIKYASNSFLATKVSFINEVANLCERVGADVQVVAKAWVSTIVSAPSFFIPDRASAARAFRKMWPLWFGPVSSQTAASKSLRPPFARTQTNAPGWSRRYFRRLAGRSGGS
jgi:UDPglucose 6-dehydrogenase